MGKQIIILLLAVSIATGICWYSCLFTPYNYFTAKRDIRKGKINYISYGLPLVVPNQVQIDSLEEKYSIKSLNIGCVVTKDEIRGIGYYNAVMEIHWKIRMGKIGRKNI
jgi:hypothetical protein